jgi:hypothetical protein
MVAAVAAAAACGCLAAAQPIHSVHLRLTCHHQAIEHAEISAEGPTPTQHVCSAQACKVILVVGAAFQHQQQSVCPIDCDVINEMTEALYAC